MPDMKAVNFMKRLPVFLALALFGAGCFNGQTSRPIDNSPQSSASTATTTSEADTTSSTTQNGSMPGTEKWQNYQNHAYGFSFKYPPEVIRKFQDEAATGTILTLDLGPTVASTTAVDIPDAKLDVKVIAQDGQIMPLGANLKDGCYDELGGYVQATPKVGYAGRDVCVTSGSDAGAGNYYHSYWYTVPLPDKYLVLAFTVHSVNCGNYDKPEQCLAFDESRDSLVAKMIMSTLSFDAEATSTRVGQ